MLKKTFPGGGAVRARVVFVVFALLVSACSGGSDPGELAEASTVSGSTGQAQVPFEVEALGGLAEAVGTPMVTTFDPAGDSLAIDDSTSLVVPEGAFGEATEVTVQAFNLAFDDYVTDAPVGRVYVVSTVEEVALATPVLLEIDVPAASQNVAQFTDGAWTNVDVAAGDRTIVPIKHFSTVTTAVVEKARNAAARVDVDAGASDASFLSACIFGVTGMFGGLTTAEDAESMSQAQFAANLAYSVCATALVDRSTPAGRSVSTECVGDKIDADTDFRGAIDECLAEQDDPTTDGDGAESADAEEAAATAAAETSPDEGSDDADAVPSGPIEVRGAATTGAIANGTSDDLFSVDFVANIEGSTATITATIVQHHWFRGGPEDPPFEDQNCGVTYQYVVHYEGPSGNPTVLQGVADESTILEVQGVLCDDDDDQRRMLEIGGPAGRFEGKANGLGVDGEISLGFRSIEIAAAG